MNISTGQDKTKKKVNLIEEINAIKDKNSIEYRDKIRQLEKALGIDEVNIFKTANRKIFEENLDNMSDSEVQSLANKLKIDPSGSKPQLKQKLLRQFDTQNVSNRGYFIPQPQAKQLFSDEERQKLNKVLNG